jgi:hypothetical protein
MGIGWGELGLGIFFAGHGLVWQMGALARLRMGLSGHGLVCAWPGLNMAGHELVWALAALCMGLAGHGLSWAWSELFLGWVMLALG